MDYSIGQLAALSGVTIRTLHYYDEIGLLRPHYVSETGYRFYDKKQLLMLQQILFYKELGFELKQISTIINAPNFDVLMTLQQHKTRLTEKLHNTHELLQTINKTIEYLERQRIMTDQEMFWGFNKEKQQEYERELIAQYGNDMQKHIDDSYQHIKHFTKEDWAAIKLQADDINKRLVAKMHEGFAPDAPEVQEIISVHYQWICKFWQPNAESYTGLGHMYEHNPEFKNIYDKYDAQLAHFLSRAMANYAHKNLK
ncbi:transcriptional regulator [Candidatus Dependentiae bacterium Noda2021]|nr:transcriptional regulator [Candidatus Dependentiae bacterium Noda2021]